jgi:hypothetical protein
MTITIYHNPDCGTSRNTLAMIRASGDEPEIIEYLKTPPTRSLSRASSNGGHSARMSSGRICITSRISPAETWFSSVRKTARAALSGSIDCFIAMCAAIARIHRASVSSPVFRPDAKLRNRSPGPASGVGHPVGLPRRLSDDHGGHEGLRAAPGRRRAYRALKALAISLSHEFVL